MRIQTITSMVVLLLASSPPCLATQGPITYAITPSNLNAGADSMSSASYRVSASVGDTVLSGSMAGGNHVLKSGFVAQVNRPLASISATSGLSFPDQNVGGISTVQTVTVSNYGAAPLSLSAFSISGDFSQTNSACGAIAPNGSCTIAVTFNPLASGTRTGTLTFASNAADSPYSIALSGTGILNAQTINFPVIGDVTLGAAPFIATVSVSSGLAVALTSQTPTVCSVGGLTVTLLTVGSCTLQASQPGNNMYAAAAPVSQSFNVTASGQGGGANSATVPLPTWMLFALGAGLLGLALRIRRLS